MWQRLKVIAINLAVLIALLGGLEFYFRVVKPVPEAYSFKNGLALHVVPYVTFSNAPHSSYSAWYNFFTNESIKANVTANNRGFNEKHDFGLESYKKADNERVVLVTGGSTAWGVGSTSTDTTIAGRMQHYLNAAQSKRHYTVINLAMGSWIAYQQFIGLELWGAAFDPDWVVSMDGHNDAGVGCSYSQGVMNPLYFPAIKGYADAYLGNGQASPVFYRGWLENETIKYSAAYRGLTGKDYIPNPLKFETNPDPGRAVAGRIIVPTKLGNRGDADVLPQVRTSDAAALPAGSLYPVHPTVGKPVRRRLYERL